MQTWEEQVVHYRQIYRHPKLRHGSGARDGAPFPVLVRRRSGVHHWSEGTSIDYWSR